MGHARRRPKRLAGKLREIRETHKLSQSRLADQLDIGLDASEISRYENDHREPSMITLLAYARFAKVMLEQLIDDELELEI